jgi:hypothetical protein
VFAFGDLARDSRAGSGRRFSLDRSRLLTPDREPSAALAICFARRPVMRGQFGIALRTQAAKMRTALARQALDKLCGLGGCGFHVVLLIAAAHAAALAM